MRGKGRCRPLLFVLSSLFCLALSGQSSPDPESNFVWFTDHKSLNAVDVATNTIVRRVRLHHEPDALAVDTDRAGVWVLVNRHLVKVDRTGSALQSIELKRRDIGPSRPKALALNPYTRNLWLATERTLIELSAEGEHLGRWRAPARIRAFALDLDESLWVLTRNELFHLSPAGTLLESLDLKIHRIQPRHLVVDSLGGVIWIGGKHRLLRLEQSPLGGSPRLLSIQEQGEKNGAEDDDKVLDRRQIRAIDVHPVIGILWVATHDKLVLFDRNGVRIKTTDLPPVSERVNAMAFDSRGLGLWIAGKRGVAGFSTNGGLLATIEAEKEAELVGAAGFTLHPAVSVVDPSDGALTNNPRPRLRLGLGAQCSGAPCLLPDAYVGSLDLDVELNGEMIGDRFTIAESEAHHEPETRLPEGPNTLTARAIDLFGHRSATVSSNFTVDTIPPKFVSLSPADGSTFTEDTIEVSGRVDDPTANVVLADQAGDGISLAGANFNFSVVLKPGLNTFILTARDPAGNETTARLRVTYNPVSINITRPTAGATLAGRGIVVSGDFQGPPNTGITVNGALASIFGTRFYANVPLAAGPNTLTAMATTPSGASASDTITVNVDDPAAQPISLIVEPQSGIAPLTVRFSAQSNTPESIAELAIDTNGDGTADLRVANPVGPVEHAYTAPGVFEARVTATDTAGATSTQTVAIVVNDGQQMDQLFAALWDGMNEALVQGDIAAAAAFLNASARRKYEPVFEALEPHFPAIIASYSPLRRVSISADIGEYAVVRPNNGKNQLYLIYFLRDADGVWRVDAM